MRVLITRCLLSYSPNTVVGELGLLHIVLENNLATDGSKYIICISLGIDDFKYFLTT